MSQIPLALDPPRRRTFDNFVAGRNRPVLETLKSGLEAGGWHLLAGAAGNGKSHLAGALFNHVSPGTALFMPFRELDQDQRAAMLETDGMQLAILDDVDLAAGERPTEETLFHALNRWRERGITVVMTATGLDGITLPDLRSRLELATRLTLRSLEDDDRRRLISRIANDLGLEMEDSVVDYLLTRGPRNPGRLSDTLRDLWELARSERRGVTLPLVRKIL